MKKKQWQGQLAFKRWKENLMCVCLLNHLATFKPKQVASNRYKQ
jgi:hypothetical protein